MVPLVAVGPLHTAPITLADESGYQYLLTANFNYPKIVKKKKKSAFLCRHLKKEMKCCRVSFLRD